MPPRKAPQWSEKLLAGLFILCRAEFITEKPELFPMQRNVEFATFLDWIKAKAKAKADAMVDIGSDPSHAACLLFDTLTSVAHGKKVGEDAASFAALQAMSFADRAELLHKKNFTQAVTQAYKWAKFLVHYNQVSKRVYRGPLQMLEIYGRLTGAKIEASSEVSFHMPFPLMKTFLQHNMVSSLASHKLPESNIFVLTVYIHALCRQFATRSKRSQNSAEDAKKWFADTLSVVNVVFASWEAFAKKIGFRSLAEMVSPHVCFSEVDGEAHLLADAGQVLPVEYEYKLLLVDSQVSSSSVAVSVSSDLAPQLYMNMSSQIRGHLRAFTQEFFQDVHTFLTSSEMYKGTASEELSIFRAETGSLAPRFRFNHDTISDVTQAVTFFRKQRLVEEAQVAHDDLIAVREQIQASVVVEESVSAPACGEKCVCCRPHKRLLMTLLVNRFCAMVQSDFRDLKRMFVDYEIHVPAHSVQLIITEPPTQVRKEHEPPGKNNDTLRLSDFKIFAKLVYDFLRPGGHLVLFCDFLHLKDWYEVFAGFIIPDTHGENAFNMNSGPVICLPSSKGDSGEPTAGFPTHQNVAQYALHVLRVSDGSCSPSSMVNWRSHGHFSNTFSTRTNVIENVPAPSFSETRFATESAQGVAKTSPLRLNQMSVLFLQELICRYSMPGDIVLDPFAGTFSTAAACITVAEPRLFYGCDINNACVQRGSMWCLRELVLRILKSSSSPKDIFNFDESTRSAARALYTKKFKHFDRAEPSVRLDSDSVKLPQKALPVTQILPQSMRVHLVNILDDSKYMTGIFETNGPDSWPRMSESPISAATCPTLRAAEAARFSLHISRSGLLTAACTKKTNEILGYYNGILVYENLGKLHGENVCYGSGFYRIDRELFLSHRVPLFSEEQRRAKVHIPFEDIELHDIFIVPALFCPFHYVKFSTDVHATNARLFVKPIRNFGSILQPSHVSVRATKKISAGDPIVLSPNPVYDALSL